MADANRNQDQNPSISEQVRAIAEAAINSINQLTSLIENRRSTVSNATPSLTTGPAEVPQVQQSEQSATVQNRPASAVTELRRRFPTVAGRARGSTRDSNGRFASTSSSQRSQPYSTVNPRRRVGRPTVNDVVSKEVLILDAGQDKIPTKSEKVELEKSGRIISGFDIDKRWDAASLHLHLSNLLLGELKGQEFEIVKNCCGTLVRPNIPAGKKIDAKLLLKSISASGFVYIRLLGDNPFNDHDQAPIMFSPESDDDSLIANVDMAQAAINFSNMSSNSANEEPASNINDTSSGTLTNVGTPTSVRPFTNAETSSTSDETLSNSARTFTSVEISSSSGETSARTSTTLETSTGDGRSTSAETSTSAGSPTSAEASTSAGSSTSAETFTSTGTGTYPSSARSFTSGGSCNAASGTTRTGNVPPEITCPFDIESIISDVKQQDLSNPVEILRFIQQHVVTGRALDISTIEDTLDGETNYITIDRNQILESTFSEFEFIDNFQFTFKVDFMGEESVDLGGPRKEWIRLMNYAIKEKYFDHGLKQFLSSDYYYVGIMIAVAMLQNGQLPVFLGDEILKEILSSRNNPDPCIFQIQRGLEMLGMLSALMKLPSLVYLLRPGAQPKVNVPKLIQMLKPKFSAEGSNALALEKETYQLFVRYIREVAASRRSCGDVTLNLGHILQFATGAAEEPVLGFFLPPTLKFVLPKETTVTSQEDGQISVKASFVPFAHTCSNILELPRATIEHPVPSTDKLFQVYDVAFSQPFFGSQ